MLGDGLTPREVVKAYGRGDPAKEKKMRQILRRWRTEAGFQSMILQATKGELHLNLGAITSGLARRAKAGRPDAAKLALEFSGAHNPRMQHEHSGDIAIHLELPRPKAIDVPEAEVVEDS
jgi:hypothetical protein